jgi:hypothetical protein
MKNVSTRVLPLLLALFWLPMASAHEIRPAVATATFTDTQYRLDVSVNLEALLAGISPAHKDTNESPDARRYDALRAAAPDRLKASWIEFEPRYLDGLVLEFDGRRATPRLTHVDVPEIGDTRVARISRVRLEGSIPAGSREFRFAYAAEFGSVVLRLPGAGDDVVALWLKDGKKSEPYVLGVGIREKTRAEVAAQYTVLGFTHILPYGLDHILFVLGLFLLSVKLRPLLVQVTAFTVAHTLTLALTIYGVVSLPSTIVEPLIAASIVYVAVENIATDRLHAWRPFIVFGFGLLHGMGFAGVLEEIGLPRSEALTGLITFNIGVELGQLTVITIAYALAGHWFKDRPWYRARVVVPASAFIAFVGAYWTVERVFF